MTSSTDEQHWRHFEPMALVVLRVITSSTLVGYWTTRMMWRLFGPGLTQADPSFI